MKRPIGGAVALSLALGATAIVEINDMVPRSSSRQVMWWLADYNAGTVDENVQFLKKNAGSVSGVFHCCSGPKVAPNGTFVPSLTQLALFRNLTQTERAAGAHGPILFSISPAVDAVLAGVASDAVAGLVDLATTAGFDGYVADYEPHENTTEAHAKAFTEFLKALTTALHAKGKKMAVCVSDWGILNYYTVLAGAGADWYASMSDTYGGKGPIYGVEAKLDITRMLAAFPQSSVVVGIGTVVPAACHCVYGNSGNCTGDYSWTQQSLSDFLGWVESKGVTSIAVWRADISPRYCQPQGVQPWMFDVFNSFLHGNLSTGLTSGS